jgi:hypothetical protein
VLNDGGTAIFTTTTLFVAHGRLKKRVLSQTTSTQDEQDLCTSSSSSITWMI